MDKGDSMVLSHGARKKTDTGRNRKRKGVDEYAEEFRMDFISKSLIQDGQLVEVLVCRFCAQSIGARSDRIREHLKCKKHQKLKLEALEEAARNEREVSERNSDETINQELPGPPIEKIKFSGKLSRRTNRLLKKEMKVDDSSEETVLRSTIIPTPVTPVETQLVVEPGLEISIAPEDFPKEDNVQLAIKNGETERIAWEEAQASRSNSSSTKDNLAPELLCVRWDNYDANSVKMFSRLRDLGRFVDVTLWCEGSSIKCHKIVLSSCSTFFESILADNSNFNNMYPVIVLTNLRLWQVQAAVEFMYHGEVSVPRTNLEMLLQAAAVLGIKGLSPSSTTNDATDS